jgi:hypothetical protein
MALGFRGLPFHDPIHEGEAPSLFTALLRGLSRAAHLPMRGRLSRLVVARYCAPERQEATVKLGSSPGRNHVASVGAGRPGVP